MKPLPEMWQGNPFVSRNADGVLVGRYGPIVEKLTYQMQIDANRQRNQPRTPRRKMTWLQMERCMSVEHQENLKVLREKQKAMGQKPPKPNEVPRGWAGRKRRKEFKQHRQDAHERAIKLVSKLKELGLIDESGNVLEDELGTQALIAVGEIGLDSKTVSTKDRMAALNTLLAYTKSKPETKAKVTVQTAEDWLASLEEPAAEDDE